MPDDRDLPMVIPPASPEIQESGPSADRDVTPLPQPPARKPPGPLRRFWGRFAHIILLLTTIASTLHVGYLNILAWIAFERGVEVSAFGDLYGHFLNPAFLLPTIGYTVALLGFLTAHEMGHWFMCRRYGIAATLPYYLPNPLIFGTFGAVIRIKAPITDKKALFDIGIAGPLSGFAVAVPILIIGLLQSHILPPAAMASAAQEAGEGAFWILGEPLLQKILGWIVFPDVGDASLVMSPLAMVGWFACLVTSINLLPVSQLDGGHILYAVFGRKHYLVSLLVLIAMVTIALVVGYYGWLVWGLLILVLGLRHPPLVDEHVRLGPGRLALAVLTLIIFILCFVPVPIEIP